jgi:GNAT superfamily N-acetyltransferase
VITIRAASEVDAPAITELLAQLGYPSSVASIPSRLAKLHAEGSVVLVASNDRQEIVGLGSAVSHAAVHTDTPIAYIIALVTDEKSRGQGVGRRMVHALEEWARELGCARLSVTSGEHRSDAHAFYSQCGFPYTGRRFTKNLVATGEP